MSRISSALVCALIFTQAVNAMDKSEFTAEVNKLWKIDDQFGEAAYQKFLAQEDLTEGQVRFLKFSLINYRRNARDDMTGALNAYEEYRETYPEQVDYGFLDDYGFFLGQYTATAKRVATATEYSEQLIVDTWKLGYWVDALGLYMNYEVPLGIIQREDMLRTGYLCLHDGSTDVTVIPHSVNGKEKNLMFCPAGTVVKVATPQPYQTDAWSNTMSANLKRAEVIQAEIKSQQFDMLLGE